MSARASYFFFLLLKRKGSASHPSIALVLSCACFFFFFFFYTPKHTQQSVRLKRTSARAHGTLAPVCAWRASRSGGAGRAQFVWGLLKPSRYVENQRIRSIIRAKRDYQVLQSMECCSALFLAVKASGTSAGNLLLMICHRSFHDLGFISIAFTLPWLKTRFCSPERGMYDSLLNRYQSVWSVVKNIPRFWQLSPPQSLKTFFWRFIVGTGSYFLSAFSR